MRKLFRSTGPQPVRHRDRSFHRAGYSLIELVGLMIVIASIMSLTAVILHHCTSVQKLALQTVRHEKQLDDLRNTFSRDVEQASHAEVQNSALKIQSNSQRIEYQSDKDSFVRKAYDVGGKLIEQQSWAIELVNFEPQVEETSLNRLVHLQFRTPWLSQLASPKAVTNPPSGDNTILPQQAKSLPDSSSRVIRWTIRLGGKPDAP